MGARTIDRVAPRSGRTIRVAAAVTLTAALSAALWLQRATVADAVGEIGGLGAVAVVVLVVLAVCERWSRADIVRRLLNGSFPGQPETVTVSARRAVVVHDVGTAVSKAIPLGGALGTAVRWNITREVGVTPPRFATTIIAYGIATTFVSWLLPLAALLIDISQRPPRAVDWALIALMVGVLAASALFWWKVLDSDRLEEWSVCRTQTMCRRLAKRISVFGRHDPANGIGAVRVELRAMLQRPARILLRTAAAQAWGALILLVALRSLGVGAELGLSEFFRVFFLVSLFGSMAPTPGGVGAIEAGMTGALVAAGVDTSTALAGVLVYRFLVYVVPIVLGAVLYVVWHAYRRRTSLPTVRLTTVSTV